MTYTPEQIDEIIERYGIDNSRNTTDDLANVAQQLRDENARFREALQFIASGCLVPPDGDDPRFSDAIGVAWQAFNQGGRGTKMTNDYERGFNDALKMLMSEDVADVVRIEYAVYRSAPLHLRFVGALLKAAHQKIKEMKDEI